PFKNWRGLSICSRIRFILGVDFVGRGGNLMFNETAIRFFLFVGILALMAGWEVLAPRRVLTVPKNNRWINNLSLIFLSTLVVRLLPFQAIGVALLAKDHGWGILNNASLPYWISVAIGVLCLDLAIYLQHAMFHAIPTFWRFHRVHHTDLDVTTGIRFHPVEMLLSMRIKMAAIVFWGTSALAIVIFEVLLNATSMFNHGNVRFPGRLDRVVRLFVVTPDMHRVHHSVIVKEHNSNFGFNFPWWDRILGTYRPKPEAGHKEMTIGLAPFRDIKSLTLPRLLVMPFVLNPRKE
ncbi:MAG: sterol desaturase family protein, partial [Candidatus Zixiibacteriota bacterium]